MRASAAERSGRLIRADRFGLFASRRIHHARDGRAGARQPRPDARGATPNPADREHRPGSGRGQSDRGLLADQAEVAKLTLTATDWLTAIEGRAGSTKTTTVGAIREFAEEHGYRCAASRRPLAPSRPCPKPVSPPARWRACWKIDFPSQASRNFGSSMSRACSRPARSTACYAKRARPGSSASSSSATSISITRSRPEGPSIRCSRPE